MKKLTQLISLALSSILLSATTIRADLIDPFSGKSGSAPLPPSPGIFGEYTVPIIAGIVIILFALIAWLIILRIKRKNDDDPNDTVPNN